MSDWTESFSLSETFHCILVKSSKRHTYDSITTKTILYDRLCGSTSSQDYKEIPHIYTYIHPVYKDTIEGTSYRMKHSKTPTYLPCALMELQEQHVQCEIWVCRCMHEATS